MAENETPRHRPAGNLKEKYVTSLAGYQVSTIGEQIMRWLTIFAIALLAGCEEQQIGGDGKENPPGSTQSSPQEPGNNPDEGGEGEGEGNGESEGQQEDEGAAGSGSPGEDEEVPPPPVSGSLTLSVQGEGSVTSESGQLGLVTSVTLTATAAPGWRFHHWMGDLWEGDLVRSNNPLTIDIVGPTDLTAVFTAPQTREIDFHAVYDKLTDTSTLMDTQDLYLSKPGRMSRDGQKVVILGVECDIAWECEDVRVVVGNTDGSDFTRYDLSVFDQTSVAGLTMNRDASRLFLGVGSDGSSGLYTHILKIEGGTSTLLDISAADAHLSTSYCNKNVVEATGDGEYVYFTGGNPSTEIWRVRYDGSDLERVLTVADDPDNYGQNARIGQFAISDDAQVIALVVRAYNEGLDLSAVFSHYDGAARKLTESESSPSQLFVSADGSLIAFRRWENSHGTWYSASPDGGSVNLLLADGLEGDCDEDCSTLFLGSMLIEQEGQIALDVRPPHIADRVLSSTISDDGARVFFNWNQSPPQESQGDYFHYVGYLNDQATVPDAAVIESISLDPPSLDAAWDDYSIIVEARVTRPDGSPQAGTLTLELCELRDGLYGEYSEWSIGEPESHGTVPVETDSIGSEPDYCSFLAKDDGIAPDREADDGVFTCEFSPYYGLTYLDELRLRLHVPETNDRTVLADVIVPVIIEEGAPEASGPRPPGQPQDGPGPPGGDSRPGGPPDEEPNPPGGHQESDESPDQGPSIPE